MSYETKTVSPLYLCPPHNTEASSASFKFVSGRFFPRFGFYHLCSCSVMLMLPPKTQVFGFLYFHCGSFFGFFFLSAFLLCFVYFSGIFFICWCFLKSQCIWPLWVTVNFKKLKTCKHLTAEKFLSRKSFNLMLWIFLNHAPHRWTRSYTVYPLNKIQKAHCNKTMGLNIKLDEYWSEFPYPACYWFLPKLHRCVSSGSIFTRLDLQNETKLYQVSVCVMKR